MQPDKVVLECQQAHDQAMDWLVQILPAKIKVLIDRRTWEMMENGATGKVFGSFYELATTRLPYGLGFDGERKRLSYHEVVRYCELQRSDVALLMRNEEPELADHGGKRESTPTKQGDNITLPLRGTDPTYLTRRLKRDHREIAKALAAGEYPSARAAAIAAGIIKVASPFEKAMKLLPKMSQEERMMLARECVEWNS